MKWRYEESTKTIRAVPSNHWIASMDSWDGAEDHEANAHLIARAPELKEQNTALLEALEGFLELHATFMADAGFNPPICECELCIAGREAIRKATE